MRMDALIANDHRIASAGQTPLQRRAQLLPLPLPLMLMLLLLLLLLLLSRLLALLRWQLLLLSRALKRAEHRRTAGPKSGPCLSAASLGRVPRRPRSAGHRRGEASTARVRRQDFWFLLVLQKELARSAKALLLNSIGRPQHSQKGLEPLQIPASTGHPPARN
jgi:hypothetical protein